MFIVYEKGTISHRKLEPLSVPSPRGINTDL